MLKVSAQTLGSVAILCLQGRIVTGDTEEISKAVRSQANASVIILDFSQVELVDAKGLGVLLELREYTQSKGIEFRLMNVSRLIQQVLEITCLNSVFDNSRDGEIMAASRGHPSPGLRAACFQGT